MLYIHIAIDLSIQSITITKLAIYSETKYWQFLNSTAATSVQTELMSSVVKIGENRFYGVLWITNEYKIPVQLRRVGVQKGEIWDCG